MHEFFTEVKKYSALENVSRTDLVSLPERYVGKEKIKAILLGADPTNIGLKSDGLIEFDHVFGINSIRETTFFKIQKTNLEAIGLAKENCYIQNLCRNYFTYQTSENPYWFEAASIWKKHLRYELQSINPNLPILATSNEVFTSLTGIKGPFTNLYNLKIFPLFFSKDLERTVIELFRGRSYILYNDKWADYKDYLTNYFKKL